MLQKVEKEKNGEEEREDKKSTNGE